jgi:hypothetical protein
MLFNPAYREVRDDKSETNWLLINYEVWPLLYMASTKMRKVPNGNEYFAILSCRVRPGAYDM